MKEIKEQSKKIVLDNKVFIGELFLVWIILIVGALLNLIPFIGNIAYFILGIFIYSRHFGLSYYYSIDEGNNRLNYVSLINIKLKKFSKIYLLYFLRILGIFILGFITCISFSRVLLIGFSRSLGVLELEYPGLTTLFLSILGLVCFMLFIIQLFKVPLKFGLSFFMAFDNDFDNISAKECFKLCGKMMKGHKFEYFLLQLSFFPLFLLSLLTFGLALIIYNPYFTITMSKYYLFLKENFDIDK